MGSPSPHPTLHPHPHPEPNPNPSPKPTPTPRPSQVPTFRLLSTGNRPDLALAKGHKWHLFLSHIWGTGQDQCATIKRQLSLLLTGVSVFLDVDDLEVTPTLTLTLSPSPSLTLTLTLSLSLSLSLARTSAPWRSTSSRPPSS